MHPHRPKHHYTTTWPHTISNRLICYKFTPSIAEGKSRWTQRHFRWLEEQRFAHPAQQVEFQEYIDTLVQSRTRVAGLEGQMREALIALRIDLPVLVGMVRRSRG